MVKRGYAYTKTVLQAHLVSIQVALYTIPLLTNIDSMDRKYATLVAHTSGICISQLSADHSSISCVPAVITHSSPLVIDAHLHSALILTGSSQQTNISIGAGAIGTDCRIEIVLGIVHKGIMSL